VRVTVRACHIREICKAIAINININIAPFIRRLKQHGER
jgi:hypothetical protein